MKLNQKLQQSRLQTGYTQKEAAKHIEVTERTVRSYELGTIAPPISKVQRLANLYHVSVAWLVLDDGTVTQNELDQLQQYINEHREQLEKDQQ
ncbi:MAG TPA: helix-turn-helix transcriptional regulator [Tetragenococcus sp.]|nr:helix-turn-helix transcriptional regulator [Tetragenococcus sp.]